LTKSFAKEQNLEKANKLKITILNFVENLSEYEMYFFGNEYENNFFWITTNVINETTVESPNPLSKYKSYYERLFKQEMPFYDN
jgi:hypothetical protein